MNVTTTFTRNVAGVCLGLSALTACTGGQDDSTNGSVPETVRTSKIATQPVQADQLVGEWGADPQGPERQKVPWIRFKDDGSYEGFDGCSNVGGSWAVNEAAGTVSAEKVGAVGVACEPSLEASFESMKIETNYLAYKVGTGEVRSMRRR